MSNVNKQQQQASSPINIDSSSVSRSSGEPSSTNLKTSNRQLMCRSQYRRMLSSILGFHSAFISPSSSVPSSFTENHLDASQQQQQQQQHHHHIPLLSQSPQFSSPLRHPATMPIRIPTNASTNIGLPPASSPQIAGLFPITQSHSLPAYFFPQGNLAYFITNSGQHAAQPLHIIAPLHPHSLQFPTAHYSPLLTTHAACANESLLLLHSKRQDNEDNKQVQPMDTTKQGEEQLPIKKRRYTGQQPPVCSPMDTHQHDDEEASNESMKK